MQVSTTCPYCGVGCGMRVDIGEHIKRSDAVPVVSACATHPANFGRVCSKGSALTETLDPKFSPARLTHPQIDGQKASWSQTTDEIAKRIKNCIAEHGPDSVAFYLSGQLLTEDYYVANKLAKGFLGTANVDTNSRLCMSSAVAAYKRAFGSDTVPCNYEDIEQADLLVLVGSNAAWTHPVLYQRMVQAKQDNPAMHVVLVDPRETATADLADTLLAIKPSSDNFLFQGLLNYIISNDLENKDYIAKHTEGFAALGDSLKSLSLEQVGEACGLSIKQLTEFYDLFSSTKKVVTFYSQGINQSSSGTDKCNAIINAHLALGAIGYAGAGPFSITGQPNAMGGREVGGLANMLAAHMEFQAEHIDLVQRFWQAPRMASKPGLKAVDLFDAIAVDKIKLVWIMATNPAVSLPDSNAVRAALEKCDTVIVSDVTSTDTTQYADILLPAQAWGEKDGTVTNSERRISRQRGFTTAPGEAKADWWALSQVANKLGFSDAFDYHSSHDVFCEHARLSAFENNGNRDFDLSGLADLSAEDYQALTPIQWPVTADAPQGTARLFTDGRFFTESGKAQFITSEAKLAVSFTTPSTKHTRILNTGRLRDQWHTMTRTGSVPRLAAHHETANVWVHPADALKLGLKQNSVAKLENERGAVSMVARLSEQVKKGELFSPIHWNQSFANDAVVNQLVPAVVDPVSGQPEFKATAVSIKPMLARSWARVASRTPIENLEPFTYWSASLSEGGLVYLLGLEEEIDWRSALELDEKTATTSFTNPIKQRYSLLAVNESAATQALVFEAPCASELPSCVWLATLLQSADTDNIAANLRGEVGGPDKVVCACFGTTRKSIESAIEQGANSSSALAEQFGCGSKCGSCKPELNELLRDSSVS